MDLEPVGADTAGQSASPGEYNVTEVVEALRNKRKPRAIKSCFPCRHRKVRCDGCVPCSNCVRRDHVDLCRTPVGIDAPRSSSTRTARRLPSPAASSSSAGRDLDVPNAVRSHEPSGGGAIETRLKHIADQLSSLQTELLHTKGTQLDGLEPLRESIDAIIGAGAAEPANHDARSEEPQMSHPGLGPAPEPSRAPRHSRNHFLESVTGAHVFLGSHSDSPLALGCHFPESPMPNYLEPRAYAFVNLWAQQITLADVARSLPKDSDIVRYWQVYETFVHPFYPVLVSVEEFGNSLFTFLENRSAFGAGEGIPDGTDPSWLGLLFSVLACGVQFSTDAIEDRDLRSKVFVCASFQCLRMSNLLSQTDLDQIQAMALIGHCLRNNLDMNAAWILMGVTIRMAQSIGLHEESSASPPSAPGAKYSHVQKKRLWWMLVWQDTFLSLTYDRPQGNLYPRCSIPPEPSGESFANSIFAMCQIILDRSRLEQSAMRPINSLENTQMFKKRYDDIFGRAAPFLTDKAHCKTLKEHLERLALRIHTGYGISRLYRLHLESDESTQDPDIRHSLVEEYISHAMQIVESFLDIHRLSQVVCRVWAFVHNVSSTVISLRNLASVDPSVSASLAGKLGPVIRRLIDVLDVEDQSSKWYDADANVRRFGPHSRVVEALKDTFSDLL